LEKQSKILRNFTSVIRERLQYLFFIDLVAILAR